MTESDDAQHDDITADDVRAEAEAQLVPIAAALPLPVGRKPSRSEWLEIGDHDARRAARCPASAAEPIEPFEESIPNSRRRLALAALRISEQTSIDLHDATSRLIWGRLDPFDRLDLIGEGLVAWLDEAPPLTKTAAHAVATSYALTLRRITLNGRHFVRPRDKWMWNIPGTLVRVWGRGECKVDLASPDRAQRSRAAILTVRDADPDPVGERIAAEWVALCYSLVTRTLPKSVVVRNLRSGQRTMVTPSRDALRAAIARARLAVDAQVGAATGRSLTTNPGYWCSSCLLKSDCPDRETFESAHIPPPLTRR